MKCAFFSLYLHISYQDWKLMALFLVAVIRESPGRFLVD